MAQILSVQGSPLMGSPIMVTINPEVYHAQWSFHHVMLRVYAALVYPEGNTEGTTDADFTVFDFSTPVETKTINGQTENLQSRFDIGSALRAVADKYEYNVAPPNKYPYVKFYIEVWDDYIYNGSSEQTETVRWPQNVTITPSEGEQITRAAYCYSVMGAFTDYERMRCANEYRSTYRMTRKPTTSPEVVYAGRRIIRPNIFDRALISDYGVDTDDDGIIDTFVEATPNGPQSVAYLVGSEEGMQTFGEGVNAFSAYVAKDADDVYEIRFVNSLGCLESVHLKVLPSTSVNPVTERNVITKAETFNKFSRMATTKEDIYEKWKMTSGPLDEAWQAWFVYEFLSAKTAWINIPADSTDVWIPCSVSADKITLVDKVKNNMLEIQFDLQLDISGSALAAIAI